MLATDSYPILKITEFILPQMKIVPNGSIFQIYANIEGNLSDIIYYKFYFGVYVRIETGKSYYYEILLCQFFSPFKLEKENLIFCLLNIFKADYYWYDNIYLTPYIFPYKYTIPFQVIIENNLLKSDNIDTKINSTNNKEIKTRSSGFSAGLIIAIVIPGDIVVIGMIVIAVVCHRAKAPPTMPNLPNKRNDFLSSEENKVTNSGN